jgi:hypothetical protein
MAKHNPAQEALFATSKQVHMFDKSYEERIAERKDEPVECLGQTFPSEDARRAYYLGLLAEKLKDPEFRAQPGFPVGTDEAILRMSDPPWYTACPNPWLGEFVRVYGKPYDAEAEKTAPYHREPMAVDVSVGKTDALYKAHGYHTKVPHLAIVPSILHYTKPGDIVLDGFCGSGMTGVAAQFCGTAPLPYRKQVEGEWRDAGLGKPEWGARRVVLNDLGPAASFIAANYNLPFDVDGFAREAQRILDEVEAELGWMYQTLHSDGKTKGRIEFTVWSEVFTCPDCSGEVVFFDEALDPETKRVRDDFPCPHCQMQLTKTRMDRFYGAVFDPATGTTRQVPRRRPVLIQYAADGRRYEKRPDAADLALLDRIDAQVLPAEVPKVELPYMHMTHERARMDVQGVTHVHHFFLPRAVRALATLWRKASTVADGRLRNELLYFFEQAVWGMSLLARYAPTHFSQVNQYLNGVYYIGSQVVEVHPRYILDGKLKQLQKVFEGFEAGQGAVALTIGSCASIGLPTGSVDYIFTDPPFGENIYYSDLNFLVESWHHVVTDAGPEAIQDQAKKKGLPEYQHLMHACFAEYYRVLKPGRWMTVVFSNSSNAVWRAIQEALGTAGFVVADVRNLDKEQLSYRQQTSSAVKADLVISAYKPTEALQSRFKLGTSSADAVWALIREHLSNIPVFVQKGAVAQLVAERTPQVLHDRMIAFHVQRSLVVPLSTAEFMQGLNGRFPHRDGMAFLSDQVAEYDKKRMTATELKQLTLFVTDESSAILWLRQQLERKPQTFADLQPQYMTESQSWVRHEASMELRDLLHQNFLCYDGTGPVPSQIHSALSTNHKDMRNLPKDDPNLRAMAKDRWYVPDPNKQADLDKLREKALVAEFELYKASKDKRLKVFRTEAVRAGFHTAYQAKDFAAIVAVGKKLPDAVVQEDPVLLQYFDVAAMLVGE